MGLACRLETLPQSRMCGDHLSRADPTPRRALLRMTGNPGALWRHRAFLAEAAVET